MARDDPAPWLATDLRRSAVRVLAQARATWPVTTWMAGAVHDLHGAVARADAAAFRRALRDLECAGPVRATGIDEPSPVPPRPKVYDELTVRDRIDEIIGRLDDVDEPAE